MGRRTMSIAVIAAWALVACGGGGSDDGAAGERADEAPPADAGTGTEAPSDGAPAGDCPTGGDGVAWEDGPSSELVTLSDDQPVVRAAVYPRPDSDEGNPWSQWGQGVVLDDGRFLSAMGDHRGPDGNSYLFEFDPASGSLTRVGDVLSLVDHEPGSWGYGKVHAQMVEGPCGDVFAATYWGTGAGISYDGSYRGDRLLRLDPDARTTEDLGVVLEEHGVPSLAGWPGGGLLYAEAVDPALEGEQRGALVVLDMATGERVFATPDDQDHRGFRAMAVDDRGGVTFSRDGGRLARWDPETEEIEELDITVPGKFLRAATPPGPDGTVYLATEEPDVLFAYGPDGTLRELGELAGYTTSLALAPDGSRLWYVPGAHGDAAEQGTPVIEVDTATGDQEVVVELDPLARDALDLSLGGTYDVAVHPDGSTLYIGLNAGPPGSEDLFGEVVLVTVDLT